MTKLDLSALKKQNVSSTGQVSSGSQGGYISPVAQQSAVSSTPSPASVPAPTTQKTVESSKPKLSLSNFKKGGTPPVAQQSAVSSTPSPASVPAPTTQKTVESSKPKLSLSSIAGSGVQKNPAEHSQTPVQTEEILPENEASLVKTESSEQKTSIPDVSEAKISEPTMQNDSPSSHAPSNGGHILPEKLPTVLVLEETPGEESKVVSAKGEAAKAEVKREKTSSEFFPNLSIQNDDLFGDMVEMGIVPPQTQVIDVTQETAAVSSHENKSAQDDSNIELAEAELIQENKQTEEAESTQSTPLVSVTMPLVDDATFASDNSSTSESVKQSETEEQIIEPETPIQAVQLEETISSVAPPSARNDYVKRIAEQLSKLRKGGLAEFAMKRKKALLWVAGATVFSLSILGTLFGFGVFEFSKSNVTEAPIISQPRPMPVTPPEPVRQNTSVPAANKTESGSISHTNSEPNTPLIRTPNIRKTDK